MRLVVGCLAFAVITEIFRPLGQTLNLREHSAENQGYAIMKRQRETNIKWKQIDWAVTIPLLFTREPNPSCFRLDFLQKRSLIVTRDDRTFSPLIVVHKGITIQCGINYSLLRQWSLEHLFLIPLESWGYRDIILFFLRKEYNIFCPACMREAKERKLLLITTRRHGGTETSVIGG